METYPTLIPVGVEAGDDEWVPIDKVLRVAIRADGDAALHRVVLEVNFTSGSIVAFSGTLYACREYVRQCWPVVVDTSKIDRSATAGKYDDEEPF